MLRGEEYYAADPDLIVKLNQVKDAVWAYNQIRPTHLEEREEAIRHILGSTWNFGKTGVHEVSRQTKDVLGNRDNK